MKSPVFIRWMNPVLPTETEPLYWALHLLSHNPYALLNIYMNLSINLVKYGPVPILMSKAVKKKKKTLFKENLFLPE